MRRHEKVSEEAGPLPIRATGIALGLWISTLLLLAFVVVPILFALCAPSPGVP